MKLRGGNSGQPSGLLKRLIGAQNNIKAMQEKMSKQEVTGSAAGGLIKITGTCAHEVKRVEINPDLLKEDKETIEDIIAAAVNDFSAKVESEVQNNMGSITDIFKAPAAENG